MSGHGQDGNGHNGHNGNNGHNGHGQWTWSVTDHSQRQRLRPRHLHGLGQRLNIDMDLEWKRF